MYFVTGDSITRLLTRRREAFSTARKVAKRTGYAVLSDGLGVESDRYFDRVGSRVVMCSCSAEQRLLRAIFNEPHGPVCWLPGYDPRETGDA